MNSAPAAPMRVLMLCPLPYTGTIAFVMESIVGFAKRGHKVDVLVSAHADPVVEFDHPNIRLVAPGGARSRSNKGIDSVRFLRRAWECARTAPYDVTIGLSQLGLIVAALLGRRFGMPFVYFNDEIYYADERRSFLGKGYGYVLKWFERRANAGALLTVTQDAKRGQMLTKVNRICSQSLRYLPNSRSGSAKQDRGAYFHEAYGLPSSDVIVLWLGGLISRDLALSMAAAAEQWPRYLKLIYHFRRSSVEELTKAQLIQKGGGNVLVSDHIVAYEKVVTLAASAGIGLCFFPASGPNTVHIGSSSGKINLFLQCGVPCVVQNLDGLRWIEECGAGVCVRRVEEVLPAIEKILSDYAKYQSAALNVFETRLRFDSDFRILSEEIEALVGHLATG